MCQERSNTMKIEDFKLNQTQDLENVNPFVSFSCGEYEKQIIGEINPNNDLKSTMYRNLEK